MFTAASRYLVRRSESVVVGAAARRSTAAGSWRGMASVRDQFEEYGKMVFTGKVADEYLTRQGSSLEILKDPTWVNHSSDKVASAVFEWYVCVCYVVTAFIAIFFIFALSIHLMTQYGKSLL
jgi:hypothetical protein